MTYEEIISKLKQSGNFRSIPASDKTQHVIDLSSNDYLGIANDHRLRHDFMRYAIEHDIPLTSSASRLLSAAQDEYSALEHLLSSLYDNRSALIFNSGYHANVGLVSALAGNNDTLIVADKLVHASIIDGIILSKSPFERFRHNDYEHLRSILARKASDYDRVLIITESVFSMDGDMADIDTLSEIRRHYDNALLYVDEAHAFGVCGPDGLGCVWQSNHRNDVDIIVGTFGKAIASAGAFCVLPETLRDIAVNRARSFIFSTALPPVNVAWTRYVIERLSSMKERRQHLSRLAGILAGIFPGGAPSHIRPYIVGDARRAVALSDRLLQEGFKVLPIRTPTVPPGTERLRFSLCADIDESILLHLKNVVESVL